MAIVVNAGPLISLARIGQLDQDQSLPGADAIQKAEWLRVAEVSDRAAVERFSFWLDAGESEALVLAQELEITAAIDERRGRNIAAALGLPQTGTVGILLTAKRAGLIPLVAPLLDQLSASGVRISSRLHEEARRLANEA